MYRLATKCTTKRPTNLRPKTQLYRFYFIALRVGTVPFGATAGLCRVPTACAAEVCGLRICGRRSAVIVNWIRGLPSNGFLIQRSRCCAHNKQR